MQTHNICPVYNKNSKVLILGSFPSVKSRNDKFFYAHPQNRFWKVLAYIFSQSVPETIQDKKEFLLKNKIALWDVIKTCDIENSSDSTIKNVTVNDLDIILKNSDIKAIITNGAKANNLLKKYCNLPSELPVFSLPSTSPANAANSFDMLCEKWSIIKTFFVNNA